MGSIRYLIHFMELYTQILNYISGETKRVAFFFLFFVYFFIFFSMLRFHSHDFVLENVSLN